LKPETFDIEMI